MTDEQWRAAWILCEIAGDLDSQTQREYVHGATVDPEVEGQVIAIFEELESEPLLPAAPGRQTIRNSGFIGFRIVYAARTDPM